MSPNLLDSAVLVTSSNPEVDKFGTGFVIHRDEQATYVLTCAHVVRYVGGAEAVKVGDITATVVALGTDDGIDLAVLRVTGLQDKQLLSLSTAGEKDKSFITAGFQLYGKQFLIRPLQSVLGQQVGVGANLIRAWDLKITDDFQLKPGYSGSPVVDDEKDSLNRGNVIGIVSTRQGEGKKGLAISVGALKNIWQEMPPSVFKTTSQRETPTQSTGRTLTVQERRKLVDLLFACSIMSRKESRDVVVQELPNAVKGSVLRDYQNDKLDIRHIVDACLNHSDGLEALIGIVRHYEGDSLSMQQLEEFMKQFLPEL